MNSVSEEKTASSNRRMLGLRATGEEHRVLVEAAKREHRSLNSFVLRAALSAAREPARRPTKSREEILALFRAAREEFQALNTGRDPLAELLAERRADSASE